MATNPPQKVVFRVIAASIVPSTDPNRPGELMYRIVVQAPDGTIITIDVPESEISNTEYIKNLIKEKYEAVQKLKETPLEVTF